MRAIVAEARVAEPVNVAAPGESTGLVARSVFKIAEAGAIRLVGSIPTLSRHIANPARIGYLRTVLSILREKALPDSMSRELAISRDMVVARPTLFRSLRSHLV